MSDWLKIALTAAVTVLGGLTIFALQEFFLKPIIEQAKVIGLIGSKLIYYRPMIVNPVQPPQSVEYLLREVPKFVNNSDKEAALKAAGLEAARQQKVFEDYLAAFNELRSLTGQLAAASHAIRWYWPAWFVFRTPKRKEVNAAIREIYTICYGLVSSASRLAHRHRSYQQY